MLPQSQYPLLGFRVLLQPECAVTTEAGGAFHDSLLSRDEDDWIHVKEQPVLHHSGHRLEALPQLGRVWKGPETTVQDVVAIISDERSPGAPSKLHQGAHAFDCLLTPVPGEGDHLNRKRDCHSKAVYELPFVYRDDDPATGEGNHLFPQERATSTLDQVPLRVHFICTIDGQIHARTLVQRC